MRKENRKKNYEIKILFQINHVFFYSFISIQDELKNNRKIMSSK